ncbi:TrkH family potassium uptake protein [Parabacteroides bouchesdurhonensis]|uniref:TrkH family potassium uptake protein n=1 Tax=Parabacteroides bouchesdurhonensis TaxID=1936995 RepID=UPI000E519DBD|nr:potassium transporter TrkG [Parabacteroides bouchesdurhonensis]RHJ90495.1 potassium transporter [Bacteroides sp. AM07-16]
MDIKELYFSFRIYWTKTRGIINGLAEALILLASIASFFVLIYQFGFVQTPETAKLLYTTRISILMAFFTGITLRYILRFKDVIQEKLLYLDISIYFLLFAVLSAKIFFKESISQSLPYLSFMTSPIFVYILLILLSTIHLSRQIFTLMQSHIKPSLLFLLSFVFVVLVGAGLLMLPNATNHGINFIDALFTSTTSVCVTGLTTVNIGTTFTRTGLIIIMLLIQIGGIGVMTFTSFFALSFMGKSSFISKMMLKDMLNEERISGLFQVIINILFVTLFIECIGAYFIYLDIRGSIPGGFKQEIFFSVFHAISAFCNAGISTLTDNLYDPLVVHKYNFHFWIAMLIIFGGLGFPIVFNYLKLLHHLLLNGIKMLLGQQKHYIHTPRIINIHTYIVVISTLILLVAGTCLYLFFETDNTLHGLPWKGKIADAFLGAVTPRTAGFNVADMTKLASPTLMLTLILMVIGAGPMSTAGGLKVTTIFVALVTAYNAARGKEKVEVRKREIAPYAIRRAFAIIVLYFIYLSIAVWILSYTEKGIPLYTLLFEVTSALSTVGLSLDFTPSLTDIGKIIIICTMLIGRIGVFTFFVSFCKEYTKKNYTYPQENILM